MKAVGIIAEFNPFHNGHQYIIEQAKAVTNADACIVVMSGDFVQSGRPAFCAKEIRTRMALACGADLVLLLPVLASTASAELFAEGAVSLLHRIGCVDSLCFGSEICDLSLLERIADVLLTEPEAYRLSLKQHLSSGMSYPAAREAAVSDYFSAQPCPLSLYPEHTAQMLSPEALHTALSSPNSILGIEYIKALKKLRSGIRPIAIARMEASHQDPRLSEGHRFCSATALRQRIQEAMETLPPEPHRILPADLLNTLCPFVPDYTFSLYEKHLFQDMPVTEDVLTGWLLHCLAETPLSELETIQDCDTPLANALSCVLYRLDGQTPGYRTLLDKLATKNYTRSRIGRVLIHLLLHIKKEDILREKPFHFCLYARILGFREESLPLLHAVRQCAEIPLISKLSDQQTVLENWYAEDPEAYAAAKRMMELDLLAGNQYSLLTLERWGTAPVHELQKGIQKR